MKKKIYGYTMVEAFFVMAIVATLAAVGIPWLEGMMLENRMRGERRELLVDFMLARSYAVKRKVNTIICASPGGLAPACGGPWEQGWIVFMDVNGDTFPADDEIVRIHEPMVAFTRNNRDNAGRTILSTIGNRYTYAPTGFGGVAGRLVFCDPRGNNFASALQISGVGRVRLTDDVTVAECPPG